MALRHAPDGSILRPRTLAYDAAFSTSKSSPQTIHYQGAPVKLRGQPGQSVFDDTLDWWFPGDEHSNGEHTGHYQPGWYSVDIPNTGTMVRVKSVSSTGFMHIDVNK
jgi:immune inhibitor A